MEGIKLILDKLAQYDLLTNLLPGIILCLILKDVVGYDVCVSTEWYSLGVIFYFAGIVNNRFGSVFIEKICKKRKFVEFAPYPEYLKAEKKDPKLETLNMVNNSFRSFLSVFILSTGAICYKALANYFYFLESYKGEILILSLLILFGLAYRKQTACIKERVEEVNKDNA